MAWDYLEVRSKNNSQRADRMGKCREALRAQGNQEEPW